MVPGMLVARQQRGEGLPVDRSHRRFVPPVGFPGPEVVAWGEDDYGLWQTLDLASVEFRLRWIPPGEFLMGSPLGESEHRPGELQTRVVLSQGYWLAETTVTQALWQVVTIDDPSYFKSPERPVEQVSWDDCQVSLKVAY